MPCLACFYTSQLCSDVVEDDFRVLERSIAKGYVDESELEAKAMGLLCWTLRKI